MPKKAGPHRHNILATVSASKKGPGRHADGGGLFLVVGDSGARYWVLRTVVRNRQTDLGLGGFRNVGLAEAREKAAALRKVARAGGDPVADRRAAAAARRAADECPTFEAAAREWFADNSDTWRSAAYRDQWIAGMEAHAFPRIGSKRVSSIGSAEVMAVLKPIWQTIPPTALRLKYAMGRVLDWSKGKGYRTDPSPTRELGDVMPKQAATENHHESLAYADVPPFIADLRAADVREAAKAALEFLILTATRRNEVSGATWLEINLDTKIWTIPGERMKAGVAHRVPLSLRAVEILTACKARHSGVGDFVFEGRPGKQIAKNTLLLLTQRAGAEATPHGFRASFRNWAEERGVPFAVAEGCLAHREKSKVVRAYSRTDLLEERRAVMDKWAAFCSGGAQVLQFPTAVVAS